MAKDYYPNYCKHCGIELKKDTLYTKEGSCRKCHDKMEMHYTQTGEELKSLMRRTEQSIKDYNQMIIVVGPDLDLEDDEDIEEARQSLSDTLESLKN